MSRTDSPIDYDGPRTEEGFIEFLNEKCGTQRAPGGLLNEKAGRLAELDALAEKFFESAADARQALLKEAKDLAATLGAGAKHYLRVMEKVASGSEEYIEKESKRYVSDKMGRSRYTDVWFTNCSLSSILTKRTLSPAKLDEIKIKANILGAFVPPVNETEEETAEDEVKRDEL